MGYYALFHPQPQEDQCNSTRIHILGSPVTMRLFKEPGISELKISSKEDKRPNLLMKCSVLAWY